MAETIGLVASVIQVAGAGLKLSQTLYQYADGVATADRRIKDIAKEIQLTSFVITELGDVFKDGETSTLMSKNAVTTANETMKECSSVFAEIDATLKKSKKNTLGRLMLPFRDNKIELLRNHIDKLKSTLLLLMQVLSHAQQIASQKLDREAEAKQKAQIQELIELKKKSAKKYEESLRNFNISDEDTLNEGDNSLSDKTSSMNNSTSSLTFAAAAIGSSINPKTLETCVHHIRTLLEDIEILQQALANQIDGSDHSEHHQSLVGSYFRARGHLDSVLFKGVDGQSANQRSIETTQSRVNSTESTGKTPIKIRDISDTSGRRFSLPFQPCHTWTGLHGRIKRAYEGVDDWRDHAAGGQFDILDSQGYTILPEDWEETVEPGMMLNLRFRGAPMIPSSNYTDAELLNPKQTAHEDMEVAQPKSTSEHTMKGARQRVVPVIGADPSTPKTMKRKNLKALGINTTSSKPAPSASDGDISADQGSVHKDMETTQRDSKNECNVRQSLEKVIPGSGGSELQRAPANEQETPEALVAADVLAYVASREHIERPNIIKGGRRPRSRSGKRVRSSRRGSRSVDSLGLDGVKSRSRSGNMNPRQESSDDELRVMSWDEIREPAMIEVAVNNAFEKLQGHDEMFKRSSPLHLEAEPSDEEEQEQRRSRREKKRRSAGVFKHSYSQNFEEGSSYSDNNLYEVASSAHLTRRRSASRCDDHGSDDHAMEKDEEKSLVQRQQSCVQHSAMSFYPPPPPPSQQASTSGSHIRLPKPPPRPSTSANHGGMLISEQYQQQSYSPSLYQHPYNPLPPPPLVRPPQQPQESLTSAIYVPNGASFGPGVGIPPLHKLGESSDSMNYNTNYAPNEGNALKDFSSSILNSLQSAEYSANTGFVSLTLSPRTHLNIPNNTPNSDAAVQWTAERVQIWLANNGFSQDWQETFKTLGLEGSRFLDIGRGHGSKGNVAMMHQVIFPQLYRQCIASGTGWDQNRERGEGRKLRRLVARGEEKCGPRQTSTEAVSSSPVAFLEAGEVSEVQDIISLEENRAKQTETTSRLHLTASDAMKQQVREMPQVPGQRMNTFETAESSSCYSQFDIPMSASTATIRPPVTIKENESALAVDAALEIDEVDALLKEWTTVF